MDSELWGELPAELQERVLALLSPPLLCRCRMVCKKWNELLTTPSFSELRTQILPKNAHTFMVLSCHDIPELMDFWKAYDVRADRWYVLPHGFLVPYLTEGGPVINTVGAARGLICVLAFSVNSVDLFVCNPLAMTITDLPRLPARILDCRGLVAMVADDITNSYKIFVICRLCGYDVNDRFHVYESRTQRWRSLCNVPQHSIVSSIIFFQGSLYALLEVGSNTRHTLLAYDIHKNLWMETGVQGPEFLQISQLVVTNGGLYLFGGLDKKTIDPDDQSEYPRSLHIWEVQISSKTCGEIAQMPPEIFNNMTWKDPRVQFRMWSSEDEPTLSGERGAIIKAVGFETSILITSCRGLPAIFELSNHSWRHGLDFESSRDSVETYIWDMQVFLINLNLGARD